MGYSITEHAASKDDLQAKVEAALDDVALQQPEHAEIASIKAAVAAHIDALADGKGRYTAHVSGSMSGVAGATHSVNTSISAHCL